MQKVGRLTLLLAGGLLVFAAVVFIALNLYVQSQGTQGRIQQELRQRFGTALTIGPISVTPWSGVKVSNITIAQGPTGSANFLEAKNFGLRIAFFSLFSKKLVIKEATLMSPNVVWPQNSDGKWKLPDLRGERSESSAPPPVRAQESSGEAERAGNAPTAATQTTPLQQIPLRSERKKNVAPPVISEIHKVTLTDGNFRFLGRAAEPIANFQGVRFRASITNPTALHGNARVEKISLRDRFFVEQLRSPLRYNENGLDLAQISAHVATGDVTGRFTMQPETEESPFGVEMKFRGIQADQIISEAGGPAGVLQGKLDGSLHVEGKTTDPNALAGNGEIFLHDGQLQQFNLLVVLGQLFQIEELTQLHLDQAEAKYHISPGTVTIDDLSLRSQNIHLSAVGTVSFRGQLHLNSRLAINEKVRAQLFKPIRANFQPTDEAGYSAVDFEVNGTLDHPKTNLLEKVVGRDLKGLMNSFLGGGKSDRQKKKKEKEAQGGDEMAPATTPEPSVSSAGPTPANSP